MSEEIKYDDAINELEAMVAKFEKAEIGVDELVGQIKRAGYLIKTCRQKLRVVETEVQSALDELDSAAAPPPPAASDDPFADAPLPPRKVRAKPPEQGDGLFSL